MPVIYIYTVNNDFSPYGFILNPGSIPGTSILKLCSLMVRAFGSYLRDWGFDSFHSYLKKMSKTICILMGIIDIIAGILIIISFQMKTLALIFGLILIAKGGISFI